MRHRLLCKLKIGPLRINDGTVTDNYEGMANCVAQSFSSVFSTSEPDCPSSFQTCENVVSELRITLSNVHKTLCSLDPNSALGDDGLHPSLFKRLAHLMAVPLTIILNASLQTRYLTSHWLTSLVVPIYVRRHQDTII